MTNELFGGPMRLRNKVDLSDAVVTTGSVSGEDMVNIFF